MMLYDPRAALQLDPSSKLRASDSLSCRWSDSLGVRRSCLDQLDLPDSSILCANDGHATADHRLRQVSRYGADVIASRRGARKPLPRSLTGCQTRFRS